MTDVRIINGDARHLPLSDESIQCIVTSPPYWGLRKYAGDQGEQPYGLEPTIEAYIATTLEVMRECWRVLRKDGVMFWNIGDSYASHAGNTGGFSESSTLKGFTSADVKGRVLAREQKPMRRDLSSLKPKDLCLIPSRVAIAAQADGWWVRSMIIWAKPNPMPESCKDRPTDAYEHIIMLTKAERYFWNFEACQEPTTGNAHARGDGVNPKCYHGKKFEEGKLADLLGNVGHGPRKEKKINVPSGWETGKGKHEPMAKFGKGERDPAMYRNKQNPSFSAAVNQIVESRNLRNVWQFATQPYSEAHFATFPEELPRRCILAASRVGDTILDPFAGSGTVGRIAVELNRKAIMNDLAYHDLSEKRTMNVQRRLL